MTNTKLAQFLIDLCKERNESWREASMRASLDPGAISSYVRGTQPSESSCLRLADHFAIDPNKMLRMAGHSPLKNLPAWREGRDMQLEEIRKQLEALSSATLQEVVPYSGDWVWLPLIGEVPAGYPEWQEEREPEGFYPCMANTVRDPDKAYGLRVCGPSMEERGILDRDIVFVDTIRPVRSGDMVVARRDDVVVLRIYIEQPGGPYLKAANENYPLYKLVEARIMGVVVGSYRENP